MKFLYSNIPPYSVPKGALTITQAFMEQLQAADSAVFSIGYAAQGSLEKLTELIQNNSNFKNLILILGMYQFEGIPENLFHYLKRLNLSWSAEKKGTILFPRAVKNHEKVYVFYREQDGNLIPFSAIVGSANLSFLHTDASNRRQYESGILITDTDMETLTEIAHHVEQVQNSSDPFEKVNLRLISCPNEALKNIETVEQRTKSEVEIYKNRLSDLRLLLPLKVPAADFRHCEKDSEGKSTYTKSNINVCYAAPRGNSGTKKSKDRDWYEMQLNVPVKLRSIQGYPERNIPFFIQTDDGYWFKGQTESDNNKQLSAVGNEHIMGRWLKGRLAAAGLVKPVDDPYSSDPEKNSMITKEMLDEHGTDCVLFAKTTVQHPDENGVPRDVWYLSFDPAEVNREKSND